MENTTVTTGERGWVRVRELRTGKFTVELNRRDGAGWVEPRGAITRFETAEAAWTMAERRFAGLLEATR